jgi:hypothetical protein
MALTAAAVLAPFAARAQTTTTQTTTTYETPEQMTPASNPSTVGLMLGAGVANFSGGLAATSEPGAGYSGMVDLSPVRNFGVELGYLGAVNNVRPQFSTNARLITNQVGADLRLNIVPASFDLPGRLRPFIFGGAAYQSVNPQNFVPGVTNANAFAVPVGAGLDVAAGGFLIGARYTWNFLFAANPAFGGRVVNDWLAAGYLGARW